MIDVFERVIVLFICVYLILGSCLILIFGYMIRLGII